MLCHYRNPHIFSLQQNPAAKGNSKAYWHAEPKLLHCTSRLSPSQPFLQAWSLLTATIFLVEGHPTNCPQGPVLSPYLELMSLYESSSHTQPLKTSNHMQTSEHLTTSMFQNAFKLTRRLLMLCKLRCNSLCPSTQPQKCQQHPCSCNKASAWLVCFMSLCPNSL